MPNQEELYLQAIFPLHENEKMAVDSCVFAAIPNNGLLFSAGSIPAPLYSSGLSVQRHNQWSFYSSMEEVDHLIEALNPRGHREGSLKEALLQERDRLQLLMQSCNQNKYSHTGNTRADGVSSSQITLKLTLFSVMNNKYSRLNGTLK